MNRLSLTTGVIVAIIFVGCPAICVIILLVLAVGWLRGRGEKNLAQQRAQARAEERYERELILALKSLGG